MPDEVKDGTTEVIGDSGKADPDSGKSPDTEAALEAKGKLDDLLEVHGYDSLEDLTEAIQNSKSVMSKIGDKDMEEILEKANTLDKYNEYWAAEELKKKDENIDDSDRIARLEKELDSFKSGKEKEESDRKTQQEAEKVIEDYRTEITSFIGKQEEIPEEYRSFTIEFLGVNNPFNEVDITNKVAVRKMAKDSVKKIQDFEQVIIKRYLEGKVKVPDITKIEGAAPETGKVDVKNLKQARTSMAEILTKKFMGAK